MVKNAVKHNFKSAFVQLFANRCKIGVRTEPAVKFCIVASIIAVGIGFKQWGKINRIAAADLDMFNPLRDFLNSGYNLPVIILWSTAKTKRINLIKYTFFSPHIFTFLHFYPCILSPLYSIFQNNTISLFQLFIVEVAAIRRACRGKRDCRNACRFRTQPLVESRCFGSGSKDSMDIRFFQ